MTAVGLTVAAAARQAGVSRSTIGRWIATGRLEAIRTLRGPWIDPVHLNKVIARERAAAVGDPQRARLGRSGARRDHRIEIRVSTAELTRIDRAHAAAGMPVARAHWLRQLLFTQLAAPGTDSHRPAATEQTIDALARLSDQLARAGNNLNQATYSLHRARLEVGDDRAHELVGADLSAAAAAVRWAARLVAEELVDLLGDAA